MIRMPLAHAIEMFTALAPFAGVDKWSSIAIGEARAYASDGVSVTASFTLEHADGIGLVPLPVAEWVRRTSFRSLLRGRTNPESYELNIYGEHGGRIAVEIVSEPDMERTQFFEPSRFTFPMQAIEQVFAKPAPRRAPHATTILDPKLLALATPYANRYGDGRVELELYPSEKGEVGHPVRLVTGNLVAFINPKIRLR